MSDLFGNQIVGFPTRRLIYSLDYIHIHIGSDWPLSFWSPAVSVHIRLASFLWDIHVGKQYRTRRDADEGGVPSGAILFAWKNFIEKWNENSKSLLKSIKNDSGRTQVIMGKKSLRRKWVNTAPCYTQTVPVLVRVILRLHYVPGGPGSPVC